MAIKFENRFTESLIADDSLENRPRQVVGAHFSYVKPQTFIGGSLIVYNDELGSGLGLLPSDKTELTDYFLGRKETDSFSMCYGGHQFGHWAGQLGDGRAINLGNLQDIDGASQELQLKGAGPTPYSRTADGYAVLRSSIREYLCSEAMYHLGVSTTRALALLETGEPVLRDMMYNGNAAYEPGAIVCRVSKSFVRFGQFEIFAARQEWEQLTQLVEYCITNYHPDLVGDGMRYLTFFQRVSDASCDMIIDWMRVGFVHGVMNTDNMSILGETIDYGPYGWMDNYDPNFTPNTTDLPGRRYCYSQQPPVAQWNLLKLANALAHLIPDHIDNLKTTISGFAIRYQTGHLAMMRRKLGLTNEHEKDSDLIRDLEKTLFEGNIDMTIFYRALSSVNSINDIQEHILPACYNGEIHASVVLWLEQFIDRLSAEKHDTATRKKNMDLVNPKYVLRNYMAQLAIDAAQKGDYSLIDQLYKLLQSPYDEQPAMQQWYALRPDWAVNKVGCSMLSCSS